MAENANKRGELNGRPGFISYHNFHTSVDRLTKEEAGELYQCLYDYSDMGVDSVPESSAAAVLYDIMKQRIDADRETYDKTRRARIEASKKAVEARKIKKDIPNVNQTYTDDTSYVDQNDLTRTITKTKTKTLGDIESIGDSVHTCANESQPALAPKKPKEIRHKYGSYGNVLLSDDDYNKLLSEFPEDYNERIERLSEYIASKGTKYKDHLATIRSWARKDDDRGKSDKKEKGNGINAFRNLMNSDLLSDEE